MVVPVVWANVEKGIRATDPALLEMARVYRFGRLKTLLRVQLPSVMPYFLAACTTGLGFAWKSGIADEVLWPISFRVLGNDLQEVYRQAEAQMQIVKEFLKSGGIKPDEITDASPKVDDAQANMYGENKRAYRYILTPSVTVSTKNVDAVLALQRSMSELIAKGVTPTEDYSFRTIFNYTKLNSIKPAMIEAATVNAREAAEKFAKDSGSTLGKIRRASQGQFQIFDRDANTRWIKNVRVVTTVEYYLKD